MAKKKRKTKKQVQTGVQNMAKGNTGSSWAPKTTTGGYTGYLTRQAPKPAMQIGKATVYGGSSELLGSVPRLSLILDLSDCPDSDLPARVVRGNETARMVLPDSLFVSPVPILHLDWPDGTAGGVEREWWLELVRWIETLPTGAGVGVGCQGGRGRTGTALAILANLSGQSGESDPVGFIRDVYLSEAVESEGQVQYIERITGVPVKEWAADDLWAAYMNRKYGDDKELPGQKAAQSLGDDPATDAFGDYGDRSDSAGNVVLGPPGKQGKT